MFPNSRDGPNIYLKQNFTCGLTDCLSKRKKADWLDAMLLFNLEVCKRESMADNFKFLKITGLTNFYAFDVAS